MMLSLIILFSLSVPHERESVRSLLQAGMDVVANAVAPNFGIYRF